MAASADGSTATGGSKKKRKDAAAAAAASAAAEEKKGEGAAKDEPEATGAEQARARGNDAYKKGNYQEAVDRYTEALLLAPEGAEQRQTLYSNRSAAYAAAGRHTEALADAQSCLQLAPKWAKAFARVGYAQFHLGRLEDAKKSYLAGLAEEPTNDQLQQSLYKVDLELDKRQQQIRREAMRVAAEKARKAAAQASRSSSSTAAASTGQESMVQSLLRKVVNPLGLGTMGAVLYALVVLSGLAFIVFVKVSGGGGDGADAGSEGAEVAADELPHSFET
eukprot:gnl/TRDRNA2_/TRDRNA2_193815_c0_seq1.p1 gnl/TRDRNA2_/TRDRNA2_193815_c0~~gnl/TRDRNA2_/TRDRNA2_193815_c0_seq1.p1  ORF type:complete len:278 (-),score=81.30 gnl/TRDRNA2_/TRDRNA2_193815_c0_seq1:165-998(-)